KTWNKKFKLEPEGGMGTVDFDLYMYSEYGTTDPNGADPVNFSPGITVEFTERGAGGEKGVVPEGMNHAITCIYSHNPSSGPQAGGNADFTYTAGDTVK
ncbi:MAG: hypothetical protein ABR575_04985, partial [Actinomycetota bacterium]